MHIGVVVSYYKPSVVYGGPVRSVSAMCEGLAQRDAKVTVLTTNANGKKSLTVPTGQLVNIDGVHVYYYPRLGSQVAPAYYYSPGLKQACQEKIKKFDVVYICGTWTYAMLAGAKAASDAGVPFVVSPRGSFMTGSMSLKPIKKGIYLGLIERRFINRATMIHCTSSLEQQEIAQWHFHPESVVIPNSLDLTPFGQLPKRGKLRSALGIPEDGTISLYLGRLHKDKRLDLTIAAFDFVAQQIPKAHLLIVGPEEDGSGKKAQEQAAILGLSNRVHFIGMLNGIALMQAFADADMHVLLSSRENFAMVVAEAMAAGLPVLVTPEVGLAEEVENAGAGYCVPPKKEEICKIWLDLLANPELRHSLGQQGKSLVQNKFSPKVISDQMLTLFKKIARPHL